MNIAENLKENLFELMYNERRSNYLFSKYGELSVAIGFYELFTTTKCYRCDNYEEWETTPQENITYKLRCSFCQYYNNINEIMEFDITSASDILTIFLKQYHPQIIASYIQFTIKTLKLFYMKSVPYKLENPFNVLESINRIENYEYILMGGSENDILIADLYIDEVNNGLDQYPILHITSKTQINLRCFLHGMRFLNEKDPIDRKVCLLKELNYIASMAIKYKSNLVLGENLEKFITIDELKQHDLLNLQIVSCKRLKGYENSLKTNPANNGKGNVKEVSTLLMEITKKCRKICDIVNNQLGLVVEKKKLNVIEDYSEIHRIQQKLLNASIWIMELWNTPLMFCLFAFDEYNYDTVFPCNRDIQEGQTI